MGVWLRAATVVAFLSAVYPAFCAEDVLNGPVNAELLRVIDGDTIEVRARIWLGLDLTTRVRLSGIDAPELDGACWRNAKRQGLRSSCFCAASRPPSCSTISAMTNTADVSLPASALQRERTLAAC
jgi:hypothetical protein